MTESLFNWINIIWLLIALVVIPFALRITAPYGRHTRKDWGPLIDNRLGWLLMELPALLLVWAWFLIGAGEKGWPTTLFLAFWTIHYGHRSLIFPFRIRTKGKKMPLSIMLSAVFFNLVNGSLIGYFLGNFANYGPEWLEDPRFWVGAILFFVGMGINLHSDQILISLRKPGETGYKIPRGGLFRWVSCPNLFGEIVEWMGFAVMLWALAPLTFFVWTAANLIPRALSHHRWYLERFEGYPEERRAVFPFFL